ncbi:hypothetical protein [Lacinutrix mariniflava]|uniref:hypothetical protein n=1 Tax=Lacinutrix mariniflava TaxID=342955 RepID=UPI0006E40669|nr:hypothetical protein [Lacinutrix mariniflava]
MKSFFCIILFYSSSFVVAQQSIDTNFFKNQEFEKVVLSKYTIKSKTLSIPPINQEKSIEEKDEKIKTYERTLTKREICKIFKRIRKAEKTHASDVNYDIKISFFNKNNAISQEIEISSFTQNIILKTENCKKTNNINPCLYLGSINKKFNRYIQKMLSK